MKYLIIIVLAGITSQNVAAGSTVNQTCSADMQRAHAALRQAAVKDNGRLWGKSLDGPIALINPEKRQIESITNNKVELQCEVETLPADKLMANTCTEWNGTRTATMMLPLPTDKSELIRLVAHERWHCLQNELNLKAQGDDNSHLDSFEGRTLLRMELRALRTALDKKNKQWRRVAEDALYFRSQRSSEKTLNTGVLLEEAKLESNEGLAEHTGQSLSTDKKFEVLRKRIHEADQKDSYLRSFAYYTGPAYGVLLDRCQSGWTRQFKPSDDLPSLLANCLKTDIKRIASKSMELIGERYLYSEVLANETSRENKRKERLADNIRKFISGTYLELPLMQPNIQFDPNNLFVLSDVGTVYEGLTLSDSWGKLETKDSALVDKNWQFVRVALANNDCSTNNEPWTLSIKSDVVIKKNNNGKCVLSEK